MLPVVCVQLWYFQYPHLACVFLVMHGISASAEASTCCIGKSTLTYATTPRTVLPMHRRRCEQISNAELSGCSTAVGNMRWTVLHVTCHTDKRLAR